MSFDLLIHLPYFRVTRLPPGMMAPHPKVLEKEVFVGDILRQTEASSSQLLVTLGWGVGWSSPDAMWLIQSRVGKRAVLFYSRP